MFDTDGAGGVMCEVILFWDVVVVVGLVRRTCSATVGEEDMLMVCSARLLRAQSELCSTAVVHLRSAGPE